MEINNNLIKRKIIKLIIILKNKNEKENMEGFEVVHGILELTPVVNILWFLWTILGAWEYLHL